MSGPVSDQPVNVAAHLLAPLVPMITRVLPAVLVSVTALAAVAACGGEDAGPPVTTVTLSDDAAEGLRLVQNAGCAACHGLSGEGGVGPKLVGLAGTQVELSDGRTVTADRDYLTRAVAQPGAEITAGYQIAMPENALTDRQVQLVVTYLEEVGAG